MAQPKKKPWQSGRRDRYKPQGKGQVKVPKGGWSIQYIGLAEDYASRSPIEDKTGALDLAREFVDNLALKDSLMARLDEGIATADEAGSIRSCISNNVRILKALKVLDKVEAPAPPSWGDDDD